VINQSEENGCLNTWHLQARGSGGGKPDNVELVREVEGLIAGMALLEELDPSRDDGEKWSRTDPEIELIHDHLNNHFRPCGNMGGCGYLRCKENFLSVYDPYNLGIRCDTASIQEHLVSCTEWKHEGPLRVRELSAKLETVLEEGRLAELISACDAADEAVKHRIPSIAEFCDNFWIARDSNRIAVACSGADCNPTVTERGRIQENRWEVVCHYLFKHNFVVSEEDKDALVLQLQSGKTRATIDSEIRRMSFVPAEVVSALETTNDPQFGLRPQSLNDLQVQTKHATSREQIMTLRSFRRRLLLLHRRILNIAGTSKKPGLRLLGKTFSRFSSFANCGFLSLRETLEKCPPSSLDEVLAFTSITLTMRDTLRILGQHPGLKTGLDLSTWVHAISGDSAQSNFIDMGKRLWPDESFDNLEAMKDISRLASSSRLASPSRLMTSPSRLMTSFSRLSILELLLRYKPELGMRDMKNAASQVLAGSANSDSPFRNFLDMSRMEDLADAFRYECSAPHRGTADGDQGCGKSEPSTRRATAEDLAASSLVLVAIEFLICEHPSLKNA
jgi:hypothetical protein